MFVVRRRIASLASRGKPVSPVGPLLVARSRQTESLLRGTSSAPRRRRLTVTLFHHPERCPSGLRSATGNRVGAERCLAGSNPALSVSASLASRRSLHGGNHVSPVGPLLVRALGGRNHCCAEQVPLRDEETREGVRYLSTPK